MSARAQIRMPLGFAWSASACSGGTLHRRSVGNVPEDGEQALHYLFNQEAHSDRNRYPTPAQILLDIKLPGIDGIAVPKRIKEDPRLKGTPVFMLTTSKREEDIDASSYRRCANSYVIKPAGFKEFEEKIMQIDHYRQNLNEPSRPLEE